MKMNKVKARKLHAIVEMLNKKAEALAMSKSDIDTFKTSRYTTFECDIRGYTEGSIAGIWTCCFSSQKMVTKIREFHGTYYIGSAFSFGGNEPTSVYLYDDNCRYDEFSAVVRFIRALLKNDGPNNMKFGRIKVISDMIDYLDFKEV